MPNILSEDEFTTATEYEESCHSKSKYQMKKNTIRFYLSHSFKLQPLYNSFPLNLSPLRNHTRNGSLHIFASYDTSFLLCLAFTYFNQGFKTFMDLAVLDYFKHYLMLEPA